MNLIIAERWDESKSNYIDVKLSHWIKVEQGKTKKKNSQSKFTSEDRN